MALMKMATIMFIQKIIKPLYLKSLIVMKLFHLDPDYFINYFDLNTDYNIIKEKLKKNLVLSPMVDYGYGIRILKGDSEEMIYSYIISQK